MAIVPALTGDVELSLWELPIHGLDDPIGDVFSAPAALLLYHAGVETLPAREEVSAANEHFWDAIKHLKNVIASAPPSARFMIARSFSGVGEYHSAAEHYAWLIDNDEVVRTDCAVESRGLSKTLSEGLFPGVHKCLINAYEQSGEPEKALAACERWFQRFPGQHGPCECMARIHQKRGDFQAAYEWLRKEADIDPAFGEDPNVSIALALGSVAATVNVGEAIDKLKAKFPSEILGIEVILTDYWEIFKRLDPESRSEWAALLLLLRGVPAQLAHLSCVGFSRVVERELNGKVFEPFRASVAPHISLSTHESDGRLSRYIERRAGLTLGDMLWLLDRANTSQSPLLRSFQAWITQNDLQGLHTLSRAQRRRIQEIRNRAAHPSAARLTEVEIKELETGCRKVLDLLHGLSG